MIRADEYNRRYKTPKHKGIIRADIGLKDYSKMDNIKAQSQKIATSPHGSTAGRITKLIPRTAATNLKMTSGYY